VYNQCAAIRCAFVPVGGFLDSYGPFCDPNVRAIYGLHISVVEGTLGIRILLSRIGIGGIQFMVCRMQTLDVCFHVGSSVINHIVGIIVFMLSARLFLGYAVLVRTSRLLLETVDERC
jgi:hypothetical protein